MRTGLAIILANACFFMGTCSSPPNQLQLVRKTGVLNVISRNGATTYYLGSEGPSGFEYDLAKGFARADHPLALCGRGKAQTAGSLRETAAVYLLNVLSGNINQEGGMWTIPEADYIQWPEVGIDWPPTTATSSVVCTRHKHTLKKSLNSSRWRAV